jgi:hypothetical protein
MAKVKANGEEFEIEEEVNPTVEHFKQPIGEIELAKKLARYRELATEIEILEEAKDHLRKELLEAGRGMESLTAGDYAAFFQKVSGRVTTDWKQAYRDAVGEMPSEDVSKYVTKGQDTTRMEVKRIR